MAPGETRNPRIIRARRRPGRPRSRPIAEVLEARQLLATITVTSAGDADGADGSNTLSLRQAIEVANGTLAVSSLTAGQQGLIVGDPTNTTSAPNTIDFAIPGTGPFTISPTAGDPLPAITTPVVIDGYSQPGSSPNTNGPGLADNAVIEIAVDGTALQTLGTPAIFAPYYASGLILASNSTVQGLAIDNFNGAGQTFTSVSTVPIFGGAIVLTGSNDVIQGNFIGTGPSGTVVNAGSHGAGVFVTAALPATIGGTAPADRNLISGNTVNVETAGLATVEGNFIGTDLTGTKKLGDQAETGVIADLGDTIGGAAAGAGNLISGVGVGVQGQGLVEGNLIGTDVTGTLALGNNTGVFVGTPLSILNGDIQVTHPANMTIGGTAAGAGNVISGNQFGVVDQNYQIFNVDPIPLANPGEGTFVNGPSGLPQSVLIQGNRIGTDITGAVAVANVVGIQVANFGTATVGGAVAGAGNVISGNLQDGLEADQLTSNNTIQGNLIGTDAAGTAALPNGGAGVFLAGHSDIVGGTAQGAGNVISGNGSDGLVISPQPSSFAQGFIAPLLLTGGDLIQGNKVGTDVTGTAALPDGGSGILIAGSSNAVGGVVLGAANTIAFNQGAGVAIVTYLDSSTTPPAVTSGSGQGNTVSANSIFKNGGLGIDLGDDGVTPNTPAGSPTGPNRLVPYPVITSATLPSGSGQITATLDAAPSTTYTIQFFANPSTNPSDPLQTQLYLHLFGVTTATTDATGHADIDIVNYSTDATRPITATATDPMGDTSEFSAALLPGTTPPVSPPPPPVSPPPPPVSPPPPPVSPPPPPVGPTAPSTTTTTLIEPYASSLPGQPFPFAAVVTPSTPGGTAPTGLVAFVEGSTVLGEVPLNASGVALFFTDTLTAGSHVVAAVYLGDTSNAVSLSNYVATTVTPATPTTILVGPFGATPAGQPVTFAVVVASPVPGGTVPTGAVAFVDGSTVLGEVPLNASGEALFVTQTIPAGEHSVAAVYLGDVNDTTALSNYVAVDVTPKTVKKSSVSVKAKSIRAASVSPHASHPSGPRRPTRGSHAD